MAGMFTQRNYSTRIKAGILLIGLVLSSYSVNAQTGRELSLSAPVLDDYPEITCYFSIFDREGSIQTDFSTDDIRLTENGIEQEIIEFQVLNPGIQIITAMNISNPFSIQDINGVSRFDNIREALLSWTELPVNSGQDRVTLLSNDGLEHTHLTDKSEVRSILAEYDPPIREIESNFNVLSQAITIASDPVDQPGMKKIVLLFTSQPTSDEIPAIDSLTSQAIDNQVRIYTILISSPAFFNTAGAIRLQRLASETGGIFIPFSGEEPLPDLGQLLDPLRSTYQVKYLSQIVTSGNHSLEISAGTTIGEITGAREFFLDIQPPNPVFISPPRTIVRELPADNLDPASGNFQPESVILNVLLDFPDNHPRDLEELIFRVDGEIVERKTEPPFDQFVWDLSGYEFSGTYLIALEAVDIMGLSKSSIQTPVRIEVNIPPPNLRNLILENAVALTSLAGIMALGLILFALISGGRIMPGEKKIFQRISSTWIRLTRSRPRVRKILPRQIPQTATDHSEQIRLSKLIAIGEISQQLFPEPIKINQKSITLGSNPPENGVKIYHHSVIKRHAQIDFNKDGNWQIQDLGSTSGTWINYNQIIGSEAQILKDGDIIHIGEAVFRFQVQDAVIREPAREE
jgi:hypothetical protein